MREYHSFIFSPLVQSAVPFATKKWSESAKNMAHTTGRWTAVAAVRLPADFAYELSIDTDNWVEEAENGILPSSLA